MDLTHLDQMQHVYNFKTQLNMCVSSMMSSFWRHVTDEIQCDFPKYCQERQKALWEM